MRIFSALCALPLAAALFVSPAAATGIAYFSSQPGAYVEWTRSPDGLSGALTNGGTSEVNFTFMLSQMTPSQAAGPELQNLPALMSINLQSLPGETALAGTFAFTYAGSEPLVVGGNTLYAGANLLSGSMAWAWFFGEGTNPPRARLGSSGNLPGREIQYASDVIPSFDLTNGRVILWDFSQLSHYEPVSPGSLPASFNAQIFGGFQAAVPEPGTWAMMIVGLGLAGVSLRRRRAHTLMA